MYSFSLVPIVLAFAGIALAPPAAQEGPWATAAEAVKEKFIRSGELDADVEIVVSHTAVRSRHGQRPPTRAGELDTEIARDLRQHLGVPIVERSTVVRCEDNDPTIPSLGRCFLNGPGAIFTFGEADIGPTDARIYVLAEHNVLSLGLQAALFAVDLERSEGVWEVVKIKTVMVS